MRYFAALLLLVPLVTAQQSVLQQPHINPPKNSKFRELVWGDLNFLHTTDTHGWYAGHLNQKQYSADWGDFVSFAHHLKAQAREKSVDLLLLDTGDRHDGNGLSDVTTPNGDVSTRIFIQQDYDLITLGNHELYKEDASVQEYELVAKHFGESYVSSNVEYHLDGSEWVPFGNKFRYFTTPNKKQRILALSFLFNFKRFNAKTRVFTIEETLRQQWFQDLTNQIREPDVDALVVFGHLPITDVEQYEINRLHSALRKFYPNTIIQYFGGHSHIRDFAVFDAKSTGLQSGRYCETVGWLSIESTDKEPVFNRRYIDFNKESFLHHTNTSLSKVNFDTELGSSLSNHISEQRQVLNLTFTYGTVPSTYFMYEYPYGHDSNIFSLLNETILPTLSYADNRAQRNRIIIINANSIRYDLYKGAYTRDSEYIVSPFQNNWNYINVPKKLALKIEEILNERDYIASISTPEKSVMLARSVIIQQKYEEFGLKYQACQFINDKSFKKGLITNDDYGCDGDDVYHNSVNYYPSPNVIQSHQEINKTDDSIDVVYYDFIEPYILEALARLDHERIYSHDDVEYYGNESTGQLLTKYVHNRWN